MDLAFPRPQCLASAKPTQCLRKTLKFIVAIFSFQTFLSQYSCNLVWVVVAPLLSGVAATLLVPPLSFLLPLDMKVSCLLSDLVSRAPLFCCSLFRSLFFSKSTPSPILVVARSWVGLLVVSLERWWLLWCCSVVGGGVVAGMLSSLCS